MAKKKVNPRRKPASKADVDRAKADAMNEAIKFCWVIMFSVMADKYGWRTRRLRTLWNRVEKLSQEIGEERVSVADLQRTLANEYGIDLEE